MPLTKIRRPKYSRKSITQELFSLPLSRHRIFNIQKLLQKEKCDAFLIIMGIDSRFNKGALEAANYLLFDCFSTRKDDIERTKADDDLFEDVVISVQQDAVHVYCNGVCYWILMPYITHWPNLRLHLLTEQMMDNNEDAESFKIQSFIKMVSSCERIALPYIGVTEKEGIKFDKMVFEKWPLIQAYAFDDFGKGARGFFTLSHQVADVSTEFHKILHQVDPVVLETYLNKTLPSFEALFENTFRILDASRCSSSATWVASKFVEPFVSYFHHGQISHVDSKIKSHPFVLFGVNTNKSLLKAALTGQPLKDMVDIEETPTHMIISGVSAQNDVLCTRTYFLYGTSHLDWDPTLNDSSEEKKDSVRLLCKVYKALTNGANQVAELLSHGQTPDKAVTEAKRQIQTDCGDSFGGIQLEVIPRWSSAPALMEQPGTVFIKGEVLDVSVKGKKVGSVAFADTVVISVVKRKAGLLNGDYVSLTGHISRCQFWTGMNISNVQRSLSDTCGEISGTETVQIITMDKDFRRFTVYAAFYDRHILLFDKRHGSSLLNIKAVQYFEGESTEHPGFLLVNYSHPEYLNAFLEDPVSSQMVLSIEAKSKAKKLLYAKMFATWRDADIFTMLTTLPPTHIGAYESAAAQPHVKANTSIIITNSRGVPVLSADKAAAAAATGAKFSFLGPEYAAQQAAGGFATALFRLPRLSQFLSNLEMAVCLSGSPEIEWPGREEAKLKAILGEDNYHATPSGLIRENTDIDSPFSPLESAVKEPELVLSIICGLPGSYKDALCSALINLVKEDTRWIYLRPPSLDSLADMLQRAVQPAGRSRRPVPGQTHKKMRVIVCCPGLTGPKQIITCIEGIKRIKIGSVTVCIDPKNVFLDNTKLTFPQQLELCAEGWTNNIVFTGQEKMGNELDDVQLLIRSVNMTANLISIPLGAVSRSEEIDSLMGEDQFDTEDLYRMRTLCEMPVQVGRKTKNLLASCDPPLIEVKVTFTKPVDKTKFLKQIKNLKTQLKPWPYTGNIYFLEGRIKFTSDEKHMHEFWHSSLSGAQQLTAQAISPLGGRIPGPPGAAVAGDGDPTHSSQCSVVATGCGIDEKSLKSWLQEAVSKPPEPRPLKTRQNLTAAEKTSVHKQRHLEPLPEGWFYNGTYFVNMDGTKSDLHPNMEIFLEEYLVQINEKIADYNKKVTAMPYVQLFS